MKTLSAFRRRFEEGLGGGVIDVPDLFIVVEVFDRGWMLDQRKPFAVERKTSGDQARIEDRNLGGASGSAVDFGSPGGGSNA